MKLAREERPRREFRPRGNGGGGYEWPTMVLSGEPVVVSASNRSPAFPKAVHPLDIAPSSWC